MTHSPSRKEKLIIYATCQGEYLANVLACSSALTDRFEIAAHLNYTPQGRFNPDPFPLEELEDCRLFLYHKVRAPENFALVRRMLERLPGGGLALPVPYLTSNLYWPLHNDRLSPLGRCPERPFGILPYRCPALEDLIAANPSPEDYVSACLALDPERLTDMDALRESTFRYWDSLDAESAVDGEGRAVAGSLKVTDFLRERWQDEMLFYILNHPAQHAYLHLANQILERLELPLLTIREIRRARCDQRDQFAIHPGVARYYGLRFAGEDTAYPLMGSLYTYATFARYYRELYLAESLADQKNAAFP